MRTLGQTLKDGRELMGFTLRQVEDATGISNPYLSMLENDKIKKPSAHVLCGLAKFYRIKLEALLLAAGIINAEEMESLAEISGPFGKLTPAEERQMVSYLKFIRSAAGK
jgi:HTH-type transcriptional regulator, competence development regulator